jgi:lactate permease
MTNALISISPVILLFLLMLGFKVTGWKSALYTLLYTAALALWVAPAIGIVPEKLISQPINNIVWWSFAEGVLKAIFPILLIILMAIYSYNVLVESKGIEVIKRQFTAFTDDPGVLVLMMVWGFGGLLEGMAGFGTAVAIPAAILIGLGFKPMFSALVALLGNTVATGFGAVGVPVTTLCNEISSGGSASAQTVCEVSTFAVLQLAPLFILIPFVILLLTDHKAWIKTIILSLWVGIVSLAVQLLCARFLGAETPAILGSIAAIAALIAYEQVRRLIARRRSAKVAVADEEMEVEIAENDAEAEGERLSFGEILRAWSVYLFILVFILVSGALCPPVNGWLKSHAVTTFTIPVIGSVFKFGWLSNAALMLLLGSVIGGLIQGLSLRQLAVVLARTIVNLRYTAITIISLIALASIMNYSGMIGAIASGLVALTGMWYPYFAPLIGAIGTFVTGSDTSSNILFGK